MVGRSVCCEVISSARYTDTECWLSVNSFYRPRIGLVKGSGFGLEFCLDLWVFGNIYLSSEVF